MATVVPCERRSGSVASAASRAEPTARAGSSGVDDTLTTRPSSATRSVKVPPTSTPTCTPGNIAQPPRRVDKRCGARTSVVRRIADVTQTLSEKVWDRHVVRRVDGEPDLLYIDLHLVHEVTSPQAFDSLRMHGRTLRRPDLTVSTIDHNNPTTGPDGPPPDEISAQADGRPRPRTARSSASACSAWVTPTGGSSTSSVRSRV